MNLLSTWHHVHGKIIFHTTIAVTHEEFLLAYAPQPLGSFEKRRQREKKEEEEENKRTDSALVVFRRYQKKWCNEVNQYYIIIQFGISSRVAAPGLQVQYADAASTLHFAS